VALHREDILFDFFIFVALSVTASHIFFLVASERFGKEPRINYMKD